MLPTPLAAVGRVSQHLTSAVSLEETLSVAAREGALAVGAPLSALMLWDERLGALQVRATYGFKAEFTTAANESAIRVREGPGYKAFERGEVYGIEDTETDVEWLSRIEFSRSFGFRSVAAVPISFAGQALGALVLYWIEPHTVSSDEAIFLGTLAELSSAAIHHAGLVDLVLVNFKQTEAIIEQVPAGVAVFGSDLSLIRANETATRFFAHSLGRPLEAMPQGATIFSSIPLLAAHTRAIKDVLEDGASRKFEGVRHPSEPGRFIDLAYVPFPVGPDGPGLLVFVTDATDRMESNERMENAISKALEGERYARDRLQLLNTLSQAVSATLDVDTICRTFSAEIQRLVPADRVSIAIAEDQLNVLVFRTVVNRGPTSLGPGSPFPLLGQALTEWVVNKGPTLVLLDKDQESDPLHRSLAKEGMVSFMHAPLTVEGRVLGVVTIASRLEVAYRDEDLADLVTAARPVSSALANAHAHAESLRLSRMKDEFVAIASHELRTPMTAIKGFAIMLEALDLSPEESRDAVRVINAQTDRLIRILDDLLNVARIEAGHLPVNVSTFSLEAVLNRILDTMGQKYPESPIGKFRGDLPMRTDSDKVEQILVNLIDNACKYGGPNAKVQINAARHGDETEVRVFNVGKALTPLEQRVLFEKFSRLERTRNDARGTGLGLYITRRLVELVGGTIWVDPAELNGVAFVFRLPTLELTAPGV